MVNETVRQRFDERVLTRLRGLGRRLRLYAVLDGSAIVSLALLAAIAATFTVDRSLWLGRDMRVVQFVSLFLILAAIAWRALVRPLRVPIGHQELALLVEHHYPQLNSRLISAVEFADPDAASRHPDAPRSSDMIEAVVRQAESDAGGLDFSRTLAHTRVRRRAAVTICCLLAIAVTAIAAHQQMGLWFQRNVLLKDVDWPQQNRLIVEGLTDGKIVVPRGDDVTVSAVVEPGFAAPRQVFIHYEGAGGLREREQMPAVESDADRGTARFSHTFERVSETLRCVISGGDARTEPFTIEVVDRPRINEVVIGITPPAYAKIEPYELRVGQTVAEALKGSRIRLHIKTNKPLTKAVLVRQTTGKETEVGAAERISELEYSGTDLPDATATYHFVMTDGTGLTNVSERVPPVRMSVRLVADRPPRVKMRIKGVGEMITPEAILPIETDFSDVYGLASARLVYELSRKDFKPVTEPIAGFEAGTKTFAHAIDWTATTRTLAEGDRLSLRAEATDFDDVSGPNLGQSQTTALRVVSREELLAELNRREQEYRQDFERLIRQQEELFSDFLTLSAPPAAASPDRGRRFAQLARLQRDYAGRVNSLRLQFEQVLAELRVNQLSSPTAEARLGNGIVEPLNVLSRTRMPGAADELDLLGRERPDIQPARAAQEAILADMQRILANMLKWEGFQEAVALLREVLKMQGNLSRETEKRLETEIFGTEPASEPSK